MHRKCLHSSLGTALVTGVFANSLLLKYFLTGDETYVEAIHSMAHYAIGVNPLGRSYVTGLGAAPPNDVLDLDSFSQIIAGKGGVPGIVIFGPVATPEDYDYEKMVWSAVYPKWHSLPDQRRFADAHTLVTANEFNTVATMHSSVFYVTLAALDRRRTRTALNASETKMQTYSWQDHVPTLTHPLVPVLGIDVCLPPVRQSTSGSVLFSGLPGEMWDPQCSEYLTVVEAVDAHALGEPVAQLLRLEPDRYHAPYLKVYCGQRDREDMSAFATLNIRIRLVDPVGAPIMKYAISFSGGFEGDSNRVNIAEFLHDDAGNLLPPDQQGITGNWTWARIPLSRARTEANDICTVDAIIFDILESAQMMYVSDVDFSGDGTPPATFVEMVTASDASLVLIYDGHGQGVISQDASDYLINGQPPDAVGRYTIARGQSFEHCDRVTVRHHIYLTLPGGAHFEEGKQYIVNSFTRHGPAVAPLTFNAATTRCECIKANQVGYSSVTNQRRFAVLGIWNGQLGTRAFDRIPSFVVMRIADGTVVYEGIAEDPVDDTKAVLGSGEIAYRLNLNRVPDGGPYKIVVPGVGSSHAFGVGVDYSRHIAYTELRGLYHQRCGVPLLQQNTEYHRGTCHNVVNITDAETGGFITDTSPVTRHVMGSWHDAGDFDRSHVHQFVIESLLVLYEAYAHLHLDAVNDIPESGNGIPDMLDEALFGVLFWEYMQDSDGGVRAGTETSHHPGGVTADTDELAYRTFKKTWLASIVSCGLFAHTSRLVAAYDPSRAGKLLARAHAAWQWAEAVNPGDKRAGPRMYACLQLWISTGDDGFHECFKLEARRVQFDGVGGYLPEYWTSATMGDGQVFSEYFFDYILLNTTGVTKYNTSAAPGARDRRDFPVDAEVAGWLRGWLSKHSGYFGDTARARFYPIGAMDGVAYGSATGQGVTAEVLLLEHRLSGDASILALVESLADYTLGLNPLGKSYVTGLGMDRPVSPLHLDSFPFMALGKGPIPGLTLYGPFGSPPTVDYQARVWRKAYPNWFTLPEQRRFAEGWAFVNANEFTITVPMCQNIAMYATLYALNREKAKSPIKPQRTFVYNPKNGAAYACTEFECSVTRAGWSPRKWQVLPGISSIAGVRVRDGTLFGRDNTSVPHMSDDGGAMWHAITEDEELIAFEDGFKSSRGVDISPSAALTPGLNGLPEGSIDGPFHVTSEGIFVFDLNKPKLVVKWSCAEYTCRK
eukprot:Opistho-2@90552